MLLQFDRATDATEYLERARTLLSTLDKPDLYNATRVDISLARAGLHAGNPATAVTLATSVLAMMVRLDSRHQQAQRP